MRPFLWRPFLLPILILASACTLIRDSDDFQVGDVGFDSSVDISAPDAGPDAAPDAPSGCTRDDECIPAFANSMPQCNAATGECVVGPCADGFVDCDGEAPNGCEANILENGNCGGCNVQCEGATPFCEVDGSAAQCVATCEAPSLVCGEDCVDTQTNVNHCGGCDVTCSVPDGALMATCDTDGCGFVCNTGLEDCDGMEANGCEVAVAADPAHCGGCGLECPMGSNVASVMCTDRACGIGECAAGFADCDGDVNNGCEVDLNDVDSCGACGNVCETGTSCRNQRCDLYVKVDTARDHVCALRESGAVDCWGENSSREYQGPDPVPAEAPTRVRWPVDGGTEDFLARDVAVGFGFTCFVSRNDSDASLDGQLYCQGSNSSVQGGRPGNANWPPMPVEIRGAMNPPRFVSLTTRNLHSCAIDVDSELWCWGFDSSGQTGPNPLVTRYAQHVPFAAGQVREVVTSQASTCALLTNNTVQCFGANQSGQLGRNTIVPTATGTFPNPAPVVGVGGSGLLTDVRTIAGGTGDYCAIHGAADELVCWGSNTNSTIRMAGGAVAAPFVVATDVQDVFMFHFALCWSNAAGEVTCRGREIEGQFGRGEMNTIHSVDTRMSALDGLESVDASYRTACGFRDGELYCWGLSGWGSIPRETLIEESPRPVVDAAGAPITGLSGVVSNSEGSCGIRLEGGDRIAHCWGRGGRSESGDGTNVSSGVPKPVSTLRNVVDIARSAFGVCAIEESIPSNELYCWGSPSAGSMAGVASTAIPLLAAQVVDPVALDMGSRHGCALIGDGTVRCWGLSTQQQAGIVAPAAPPTTVMMGASPLQATSVATGFTFSCAILSSPAGQMVCWGANSFGQLGIGSISPMEPPTASLLTDAVQIDAGYTHACAVRSGGGVACWGSNTYGQLGMAGQTTDIVLVPIPTASPAISVSASGRSSCSAHADGSVYCWGENSFDQLGSAGPSSPVPRQVPGIMGAEVTSSSDDQFFANCAQTTAGEWRCWGLNSFGKLGTTPDIFFAPTLIERSTP